GLPRPISANPSMSARLPIAVGGAMTTAAKPRAFRELQLVPIAGLEHLQIVFVMAIETKIVSVVTSMPHHNVRMFLGNNQIVLVIEAQRRRLVMLVTAVAIEIRE